MTEPTKDFLVLSNQLVEGKYNISLNEGKILGIILSKISIHDTELKPIKVYIKDVLEGINDNKLMYSECRKITRRLMSRVIEFIYIDVDNMTDEEIEALPGNPITAYQTHFIQNVRFYSKSGYFTCVVDEDLAPHLIQLRKNFTIIDLNILLSARLKYTGRIYQLLKQYLPIGQRTIYLDWLRDKFILPKHYNQYKWIRRDIIEPSLKEIHKFSNIRVKYETIKEGRKVVALRFFIKQTKQRTIFEIDTDKAIQESDIIDVKPLTSQEVDDLQEERIYNRKVEIIIDKFNNLPDAEQEQYRINFIEYIKGEFPFLIKYVEPDIDMNNPMIEAEWILFLEGRITTPNDFPSIEDE